MNNDLITPAQLAEQLGHVEIHKGKKIRDFLRKEYPRTPEEMNQRWYLTNEQADRVRAHFKNQQ